MTSSTQIKTLSEGADFSNFSAALRTSRNAAKITSATTTAPKLRRVGNTIYSCPQTSHWADWRDAQSVAHHGQPVAQWKKKEIRDADDRLIQPKGWVDMDGRGVDSDTAKTYSAMRSVGIATY